MPFWVADNWIIGGIGLVFSVGSRGEFDEALGHASLGFVFSVCILYHIAVHTQRERAFESNVC